MGVQRIVIEHNILKILIYPSTYRPKIELSISKEQQTYR